MSLPYSTQTTMLEKESRSTYPINEIVKRTCATISAASMATSLPLPIAIPMSAAFKLGASLTPSPYKISDEAEEPYGHPDDILSFLQFSDNLELLFRCRSRKYDFFVLAKLAVNSELVSANLVPLGVCHLRQILPCKRY